jgi:hypothetical protein
MNVNLKIAAVTCAFLIGACGVKRSKRTPTPEQPPVTTGIFLAGMLPTTESVQSELVNKHCLSCHAAGTKDYDTGETDLDLTDLKVFISAENNIVIPKNPAGSLFYTEIASGDMPEHGDPISVDSVDVVKTWIESLPLLTPPSAEVDSKPEETIVVTASLESIQNWVNHECVKCHKEATEDNHDVDLSNISLLIMTSPSDRTSGFGGKIITPHKPLTSIFYTSMDDKYTTEKEKLMPKKGAAVDPAILATIRSWIELLPALEEVDPCIEDPNRPECEPDPIRRNAE